MGFRRPRTSNSHAASTHITSGCDYGAMSVGEGDQGSECPRVGGRAHSEDSGLISLPGTVQLKI